jgi:hypothetical protein
VDVVASPGDVVVVLDVAVVVVLDVVVLVELVSRSPRQCACRQATKPAASDARSAPAAAGSPANGGGPKHDNGRAGLIGRSTET